MSTRSGRHSETVVSTAESRGRSIFLVGFMGAGKSSVGLALSQKLGWPFEDLDDRIESQQRRSIEKIFQESGEVAFRQMEHEALRSLIRDLANSSKVVAVGGGAFVQENNAALLEECGFPAVFLDAPIEELFRRCQQQQLNRPLRRDLGEFRSLYQARRPYYLRAALRIETAGKEIEEIVSETIRSLGLQ